MLLIDGAQSVPHKSVDVQAIDCDFFVFSGHKVFSPTVIGVVCMRRVEGHAALARSRRSAP